MAKRFTDTDKWKKSLIKSMPAEYKLLWLYICDDCDHAGIWHVDIQIAALRIGCAVTEKMAIEVFGEKIVVFDGGEKWFIPGFIEFQYGVLNEKNRVHESILKILIKYNLLKNKPLTSPLQGAKDKDKEKDKDMDKGVQGENQSLIIPKMLKAFTDVNPDYPTDRVKDSPALLDIAKFICDKAKTPFIVTDQGCVNTVMEHWQHLCKHIPKDNFFKNYSISQISKHIQSIVLSIQNGKSSSKARQKSDAITEYLTRDRKTGLAGAAA